MVLVPWIIFSVIMLVDKNILQNLNANTASAIFSHPHSHPFKYLNTRSHKFIKQNQVLEISILRMKIKLTFVLFCLVYLCSSIVDRTYYIYLGLDIQATQSQIQSAYQEKKAKIESLQDPAARETKTKLLEEGRFGDNHSLCGIEK